jgi:hydrogenase nickel incorporation protein HypA/HybF
MHELSIALSMLDELEEQVEKHGGASVEAVHVRIGILSGVDPHALRFAYELACEGTPFVGSRLEIESVRCWSFVRNAPPPTIRTHRTSAVRAASLRSSRSSKAANWKSAPCS